VRSIACARRTGDAAHIYGASGAGAACDGRMGSVLGCINAGRLNGWWRASWCIGCRKDVGKRLRRSWMRAIPSARQMDLCVDQSVVWLVKQRIVQCAQTWSGVEPIPSLVGDQCLSR